jgi:hypothetical protein
MSMLLKKQSNIYRNNNIYILLFITIDIFLVIRFYVMFIKNNKSKKFSSLKNTECEFCCNML